VDLTFSSRGVVSEAGGGAAAATRGSFSFTSEAVSVVAVLALAGGASMDEEAAGRPAPSPPKLRAISSKVLPLVSGTLRKVKMKKKMRKAMKMRKTQGPHHS